MGKIKYADIDLDFRSCGGKAFSRWKRTFFPFNFN